MKILPLNNADLPLNNEMNFVCHSCSRFVRRAVYGANRIVRALALVLPHHAVYAGGEFYTKSDGLSTEKRWILTYKSWILN